MRVEIMIGTVRQIATRTTEVVPEIKMTSNARTTLEAIDKAMRHLVAERDALLAKEDAKKSPGPDIDPEDEDEEEDNE